MKAEDTMIAIGADMELELVRITIGTAGEFAICADDAIEVARGIFLAANRLKTAAARSKPAAPTLKAASPAAMKLN